jgi:hypothetical protein
VPEFFMRSSFFFDSIAVAAPREAIYKRLGYRKGTTTLQPDKQDEIDRTIDEALALIQLRGVAVRLAIEKKTPSETVLANGERLQSRSLGRMLKGSEEILVMGATAGHAVMEAIGEYSRHDRLTLGVILDATASETVDHALDWMAAFFNQSLRRENKLLTKRRFSAGYGDFLLENQQWIFRVLELDRLDVQLTKSHMLVPEKSVTALAGIERVSP